MPSKSTKPKKTSSKKTASKTTTPSKSAPAPVPVSTPVSTSVTTTENVVVASNPNEQFTEFAAKLQQMVSLLSSLKSDFKNLEKQYNKEVRVNKKLTAKKKKKQGNRQPSGFVKPTQISEELAEFLGKTKGTEMARNWLSATAL